MRGLIFSLFALASTGVLAQSAAPPAPGKQPIEITATGGTNYLNGIATARDNVAIHIGDTDIYGDRATYNPQTHDVHIEGNVRIYRGLDLFVGESASYNTETKKVISNELRTANYPFFIEGNRLSSLDDDGKLVERGTFTTHDSAQPDFQVRASTVRIYEGDRVILRNAVFYVGRVPIFYWPYFYQSLDNSFSFVVSPAYLSSWGPSILSRLTFPITDDIQGTVRLDYRYKRGIALGFSPDIEYGKKIGKKRSSLARIRTYFADDNNPTINRTSLPRDLVTSARYRLSIEDRTAFTTDLTGFATFTKLSDPFILQDFFQSEFRLNPEPDNVVALNYHHALYSVTAFARFQANNFYDTTERLPEVALDVKRQPILDSPIFYEGESSIGELKRNFAHQSAFQDYSSLRLDTFHQFLYPNTYFGWLSVIPRVGFRATYYSQSRDVSGLVIPTNPNPLVPDFLLPDPTIADPIRPGGDRLRLLFNTGVEASFKISRTWETAQNRMLGLDGLRHIFQPYFNYSYVTGNNADPADILQFDRYQPSTQLRPLDFPQFNSIDSIANWNIARIGVRNRLQTRRDDSTINWLELDSFFDVNFDNPYDKRDYSNINNNLRFNPVPWASLGVNSQLPILSSGFTEVNSDVRFQPAAAVSFTLGHRLLTANPFFTNSNLFTYGVFYRMTDNWSIGASGRYEAHTGIMEEQRYTIYRDLTSWIASVGAVVRDNGGKQEYGVLLSFTLKALPKFSFDLNFDPGSQGQ